MTDKRYPIIYVPPSMCSRLHRDGVEIWPPPGLLGLRLQGGLSDPEPMQPVEVMRQAALPAVGTVDLCGEWLGYLERLGYRVGEDLFPFPYDWRGDVRVAADALLRSIPGYVTRVRRAQSASPTEVKFLLVGFSLGALVCRYFVDVLGGARHVARMLLAGAYDRGLPSSFLVLRDGLTSAETLPYAYARARRGALLSQLYFNLNSDIVREGIAYYQSLPITPFVSSHRGNIDIFARTEWLRARDRRRALGHLRAAWEIQSALAAPPSVPTTYVYGVGVDTPAGYYFTDGGGNLDTGRVTVRMGNGDGLVLAQRAHSADLQAGVRVTWVEAAHAHILDHPVTRDVLEELCRVPPPLPSRISDAEGEDVAPLVRSYLSAVRSGGLDGEPLEDRKVLALRLPGLSGEGLHDQLPELDFLGVIAGATPKHPVVLMGRDACTLSATRTAWYLSRSWAEGVGGPLPLQCDLSALDDAPDTDGILALLALTLLRHIGRPVRSPRDVAPRCVASLRTLLLRVPSILLFDHFEHPLRPGGLGNAGTAIRHALRVFSRTSLVFFDGARHFQPGRDLPEAQVYTLREDRRRVRLYAARDPGLQLIRVGLDPDDRVPFEGLPRGADVRSFSVPLTWPADPHSGAVAAQRLLVELRNGTTGRVDNAVTRDITGGEGFQCSLQPRDDGPTEAGIEVLFMLGDRRLGSTRLSSQGARSGLLPAATIQRLISAVRDAGLATHDGLDALAQALPDVTRAALPRPTDPQERARLVLQQLNDLRPATGALPLERWLFAAEQRARARGLEFAFAQARDELHDSAQSVTPVGEDARREAIIGGIDLLAFAFLPAAVRAGAAVALVEVPRVIHGAADPSSRSCFGTAWLLTPTLVVTNLHVINNRPGGDDLADEADLLAQARGATVRFGFDGEGLAGRRIAVTRLVARDRRLDLALLRLAEAPTVAPLRLSMNAIVAGQPLNIIQHPYGGPKLVAFRNNPVASLTEDEVRYFTDTDLGSSGAPLCDDSWQVVGLHRASVLLPSEGPDQKTRRYNVGSTITAIRDHLAERHPDLWDEIQRAQPGAPSAPTAPSPGPITPSPSPTAPSPGPPTPASNVAPRAARFDADAIARYQAFAAQIEHARQMRVDARAALAGSSTQLLSIGRDLGLLGPDEALPADGVGTWLRTLEGIIGTDDLLPVTFLQDGARAARGVGCIQVLDADQIRCATGFLVAPRLLLTNHHVLQTPDEAAQAVVRFHLDEDGAQTQDFQLDPARLFIADPDLDFALVAVAEHSAAGSPISDLAPLQLSRAEAKENQVVNLIGHPGGRPKQVALRNNRLIAKNERFYYYEADTRHGSSGAPVCDDRWRVVALHHVGVPRTAANHPLLRDGTPASASSPEDLIDWIANEGVRLGALLDHLAALTGLDPTVAALRDDLLARAAGSTS